MRINQATYWHKVLNHYEKNGYYENGLTLPYLIGSRTIIEPTHELQTLRELLTDMSTSKRAVTMMRCGYLKEYVFGLLDHETNLMRKQYRNLYREFGSLIITDGSFCEISSFEELLERLEKDYALMVQTHRFSKENGRWGGYSSMDRRRLEELTGRGSHQF